MSQLTDKQKTINALSEEGKLTSSYQGQDIVISETAAYQLVENKLKGLTVPEKKQALILIKSYYIIQITKKNGKIDIDTINTNLIDKIKETLTNDTNNIKQPSKNSLLI